MPFAFVLMNRKTEECYRAVFIHFDFRNVEMFITDFEASLVNALYALYDQALHGCFFHYTQCILKRIQEQWKRQYGNDRHYYKAFRRFMMLPFVPEKVDFIILEKIKIKNLGNF